MKRDAEAMQKIMQVIRERMSNPFQHHRGHNLVNISTCQIATSIDAILAKEQGLATLTETESYAFQKVKIVNITGFTEK